MTQFIYRLQPTRIGMLTDGPTDEEAAVVDAHFRYVSDLCDRGIVHLGGRTQTADPDTFGIVVFRAESEAAADQIMRDDPAVAKGVMTARLFPFRIALWSDPHDGD